MTNERSGSHVSGADRSRARRRRQRAASGMLTILALALILGACRRRSHVVGQASAPGERYWLHAADAPGNPPEGGIFLVEVLADGRVRSVSPERPFTTRLDEDPSVRPRWRRGLSRFAQRSVELHLQQPRGPVVGSIHAGTLVEVATKADPETGRVAVALWNNDAAYIDADALGVAPIPLQHEWAPPRHLRSTLDPAGGLNGSDEPYTLQPCEKVYLDDDGTHGVQTFAGFELRVRLYPWYTPVEYQATECPARAITRGGDGLLSLWSRYGGTYGPLPLTGPIPSEFSLIEPRAAEGAIERTLAAKGTFYWLKYLDGHVVCDPWRFLPSGEAIGMLVSESDLRLARTFSFEGTFGRRLGEIHLGTLMKDHRSVMKCNCAYRYSVVGGAGEELAVIARPLPADAVSYAPGEAERWFVTAPSCEVARSAVAASLDSLPSSAAELGFHAYSHAEF